MSSNTKEDSLRQVCWDRYKNDLLPGTYVIEALRLTEQRNKETPLTIRDIKIESYYFDYAPAPPIKNLPTRVDDELLAYLADIESGFAGVRIWITVHGQSDVTLEMVSWTQIRTGRSSLLQDIENLRAAEVQRKENTLLGISDVPFGPELARRVVEKLVGLSFCPVNGMGRHSDGFYFKDGKTAYAIFFEGYPEEGLKEFKTTEEFVAWFAQQSARSLSREIITSAGPGSYISIESLNEFLRS